MRVIAIIPVRYGSIRFPGKPLACLGGRPLVQWVYDGACQARTVAEVAIATDDERIRRAVTAFGARCVMTGATPRNGTERVLEAVRGMDADLVVNVQGDEPLLRGETIDAAVCALEDDPGAVASTVAVPLAEAELSDPNAVKVVVDSAGRALYFSRAPIPHARNAQGAPALLHVGLYVFRRVFLDEYLRLGPSPLELRESLEQLRVLEAGHRIRVVVRNEQLLGVDCPEDLAEAERVLASRGQLG